MKPRHLYGAPWVWGAGPRSARVTEKAPRSLTPAPPPAKGWLLVTLIHCPCLQLSCPPAARPPLPLTGLRDQTPLVLAEIMSHPVPSADTGLAPCLTILRQSI